MLPFFMSVLFFREEQAPPLRQGAGRGYLRIANTLVPHHSYECLFCFVCATADSNAVVAPSATMGSHTPTKDW